MTVSRTQCAIAALVVILVMALVWPTLYRYDRLKRGPWEYPVRINRITGATTCFTGQSWAPSCY